MEKRANGAGSVVKLKYKDTTGEIVESRYWYVLYRTNGRQIRESSETESKMEAEALLQRRMGEAGLGIRPAQDVKNVTYSDVRDSYVEECRNKGRHFFRKADNTEYINGVPRLDEFFKGMRVTDISTDTLRRYIEAGRKAGVTDSTMRRSLAVLRAMLNQARKEGKLRLADVPYFPMPKESAARKGFVEPAVFNKLRKTLPAHLRPIVTFMYYTGCRLGAATLITWDMVNADATEVDLPGEITKSGDPLTLPLAGAGLNEMAAMLKRTFRTPGPVFDTTNLRQHWCKACAKLGLGVYDEKTRRYSGLTVHDLRRSAVRNLTRAGVPRSIAMEITGHKTEHIYERYNIVDTTDVREALIKVGKYAKARR